MTRRTTRHAMATAAAPRTGARTRWVAPLCAAAVIAAGLWGTFMTDGFSLREVQVLGGPGLPMDSLRTVTADLLGKNILTVSLGSVRRRLLRFPEVKDVTFRRRSFHRLDCYLRERDPVLVVADDRAPGAGPLEIDAEGIVIQRSLRRSDVDLPVLTGIDPRELLAEGGSLKVREALEVLELYRAFGFSSSEQLSEIHFEGDGMVMILEGTGCLVRVGEGDYREKIRKLRAVSAALDERERFPRLIDLRFERQVVVR